MLADSKPGAGIAKQIQREGLGNYSDKVYKLKALHAHYESKCNFINFSDD